MAAGLRSLGAPSEVAGVVVPVLSFLLAVEEERPRDFDPEQLKRQIVLAACTLVERRLEHGPVLLLVEDLHWADAASAELLRDIVEQLAERPLMMLISQRPDASPLPVARASQNIIQLAPLSSDEIQALVVCLFGEVDEAAFASVQHFVATRAGGNPLFCRGDRPDPGGQGVLVRKGDRWTCTRACDEVNIPPTLHGLLLSRVDRLPAEARRMLQEAAVLGMTFDQALLEAIATDEGNVGTLLERLVESE